MLRLLESNPNLVQFLELHKEEKPWGKRLNLELLPFTDRQTYLEWRTLRKQAYKELSGWIRELKYHRKQLHPEYDPRAVDLAYTYKVIARQINEQLVAAKAKSWTLKQQAAAIKETA